MTPFPSIFGADGVYASLLRRDPAGNDAPTDDVGRPMVQSGRPLVENIFHPRVRDRWSFIKTPWSPDDIAQALSRAEHGDFSAQADLFEQMEERDGALAGFMQTRRLAPTGLPWTILPKDESDEAEAIAEFVRGQIEAIPDFDGSLRNMCDAIGKSVSVLEIDWQEGSLAPETNYRIDGLNWINAKRYRFDWRREEFRIIPDDWSGVPRPEDASFQGIGIVPPPFSTLLVRSRVRTSHPARGGVLRVCVWAFLFRNYALKDLVTYCDIFGMPLRVGKYPVNANDNDKMLLMQAMQNLGTDAAAIVSELAQIEIVESKGTGGGAGQRGPYMQLLNECERQYQFAILGQEHTNTANKFGTRAQTEAGGAKVKQDLLEADCKDLQIAINRDLIYPIVGFSRFGWTSAKELCPRFKFHYEPEQDLEKMIAVDVPLIAELGLPQTLDQIATRYNRELPDGTDGSQLIEPKPNVVQVNQPDADIHDQVNPNAEDQQKPGKSKLRQVKRLELRKRYARVADNHQEAIDELADVAVDKAEAAMASLIEPLQALVKSADSLSDLELRIRKAYGDLDASKLEEYLRRSMFVARLHGMTTVRRPPEQETR